MQRWEWTGFISWTMATQRLASKMNFISCFIDEAIKMLLKCQMDARNFLSPEHLLMGEMEDHLAQVYATLGMALSSHSGLSLVFWTLNLTRQAFSLASLFTFPLLHFSSFGSRALRKTALADTVPICQWTVWSHFLLFSLSSFRGQQPLKNAVYIVHRALHNAVKLWMTVTLNSIYSWWFFFFCQESGRKQPDTWRGAFRLWKCIMGLQV